MKGGHRVIHRFSSAKRAPAFFCGLSIFLSITTWCAGSLEVQPTPGVRGGGISAAHDECGLGSREHGSTASR